MKKLTLLFSALLLCGALNTNAQSRRHGNEGGDRDAQRKEMVQRHADALVQRMSLDEVTARWFVPLYVEYSEALAAIRHEAMPSKDKAIDSMDDEDAEKLILSQFEADEKTVALKRSYYDRFKQRLTLQQLVKVFAGQANQRGGQSGQRGQRGGQGYGVDRDFGPDGPGFGGSGFGPGPGFGPGGF